MIGVMNNTKWNEIRLAMYDIDWAHRPVFQIKDFGESKPWPWDGEWYYHFRLAPCRKIHWVDLRARSPLGRKLVRERLRAIHVPGEETAEGFRLYG